MLPNIAVAASGGGYRALMNGAGVIEAFDSRTPNSTNAGQLGGLLQSSTYLAGLSGGSWLVGSLYVNNFSSIADIIGADTNTTNSGSLWQFGNSIFEGPDTGGIQLLDSAGYYTTIVDEVNGKSDAGFNTTITDYWGRALSYQLVNASNGGPAFTFSSIAEQDWFTDGSVPLPLLVSDGRSPGEVLIADNTTIYTFSPWELGSFDPTVYAFAPLRYVGSNFSAGSIVSGEDCVTGFDNAGYVMGTSSTLFNEFLLEINGTEVGGLFPSFVQTVLEDVLTKVGRANDDIADYPNPFYHFNNGTNLNADADLLTLVDGGEDGQNIPLHPLLQPVRHVDVIFAIDSSADTTAANGAANWPNGTSLVATYQRSKAAIQNGTAFPSIPDQNTFVNLGLNKRPTFFGCDEGNLTGPAPLIVYMPNAPYVFDSNFSTFDPSYNDSTRDAAILNAYNMATQGNGTLDSQWPTCVGCAILSRSLNRTNTAVPDVCTQCFDRYCWNGTVDSSTPGNYSPTYAIAADVVNVNTSGADSLLKNSGVVAVIAAVASALALI